MNRSLLAGIGWLVLASCGSTLLVRQVHAAAPMGAAPAGIHIVNPESSGVTWSYLIDSQTQTLAAGYSQQIDSACTITFDRGGGLGESKYSLTDGTYTFTAADGHWELYHTENAENAPAGSAAAGIGAVDEGATAADPVTPDEEKMFQAMYAGAGLNAATMKLVEEDWQGKTHAARKTDHDSFMAQIQAAGGGAQGTSSAPITPPASGPPIPVVTREAQGTSSVLFDGTSLNGWHLRDPDGPNYWSVKDGELVGKSEGNYFGKNLVTDLRFGDFEVRIDFLMEDGANSGVYLRGLYEVQLYDDDWQLGPHAASNERCGAIFRQVAPSERAYLGPGKWNTLTIKMVGQHVWATMNDKRILDDAVPSGPTDHAETLSIKEGDPGPIMLQCHPGGLVKFRNISITPLVGSSGQTPQPVAVVQSPVAQPQVLSEEDKRLFWEMYRDAGLDKATLKTVADDWKRKTSAQRKAEHDNFMKQVEAMRQAANKPAQKTNELP